MHYTLVAEDPSAHSFRLELVIDRPDPAGQRLRLPAWTPGSYMVRDFARHVLRVEARDGTGAHVGVRKLDKDTWICAPVSGPLQVRWWIHAREASVRAACLDTTGGFCTGTSVFLRPLGQPDGPFEVEVQRPAGGRQDEWSVATAMSPDTVDAAGFGTYRAADYEELVDHPFFFGVLESHEFTVAGVRHLFVTSHPVRFDGARLCTDLERICSEHVRIFGELPLDRYLFLVRVIGTGYGGLEHRASTVLDVARDSLPLPGDAGEREGYSDLLGLCSHEYFHLWHVKRIRPAAFVPFDLSREVHTTLLWAFEGMTSYYDDLALLRAGVLSIDAWLRRLARTITRVHRGTGRRLQSVAESSFDAWTRFYKADENAPNAIVSYYAKGALIALALDLEIRLRTDGEYSLDDVMRALWQEYGREGEGVAEDGVERLVARIAGTELADFFARFVHGTEDPDLDALLPAFGIDVEWIAAEPESGYSPHLGASFTADEGFPRLVQVFADRAARRAGLASGDRMIAVDGVRIPPDRFADRLARLPADEPLAVHVLRDDRLLERSLALDTPPRETCRLTWASDPGRGEVARRLVWLGATAG